MEGELPRCARPCGRKLSRDAARGPRFGDRGDLSVTTTGRKVTAITKGGGWADPWAWPLSERVEYANSVQNVVAGRFFERRNDIVAYKEVAV